MHSGIGPDAGPEAVQLAGDRDRPGAWTLLVDGTPQSHVDLGDPQYLEFEYMRRIGHLVDLGHRPGTRCACCTWAAEG